MIHMVNVSSAVSVSEAGVPVVITITVSPSTLTAAGGAVVISGTTNEPDGTSFTLNVSVNGGAYADSGLPAVPSASGAFTFTYTVPANTTTVVETYSFTAQD